MPRNQLPGYFYIPSKFVLNYPDHSDDQINNSQIDNLKNYYYNSIQFLQSFITDFCSNIDSLANLVSMSALLIGSNQYQQNAYMPNSYAKQMSTNVNSSFDLVTFGNSFDAQRIEPITIVETSLLTTLMSSSNFYMKPKSGYCALYNEQSIILVLESDNKLDKFSLGGIWLSGISSLNHPFAWSACLRYRFSSMIKNNKSEYFRNQFVVILFSSLTKIPEYYLCTTINSKLDFVLLNGCSNFVLNKPITNEGNVYSMELNQLNDQSIKYQLFLSCIANNLQKEQNILIDHHKLLNKANITKPPYELNNYIENPQLKKPLTDTASILNPKPANRIFSQDYQKYITNNFSVQNSYTNNFIQPTNNTFGVGSYHSVSDISVLSDTDSDYNESTFFNKSKQMSKLKTKQQSEFTDDQFVRPKDPPPPPANFNPQNLTDQISTSVMFGIPRLDFPKPTYVTPVADTAPSIDSPFVDITLNNCEDLSLYQPMAIKQNIGLALYPNPNPNNIEQPKSILKKPQQEMLNYQNFTYSPAQYQTSKPNIYPYQPNLSISSGYESDLNLMKKNLNNFQNALKNPSEKLLDSSISSSCSTQSSSSSSASINSSMQKTNELNDKMRNLYLPKTDTKTNENILNLSNNLKTYPSEKVEQVYEEEENVNRTQYENVFCSALKDFKENNQDCTLFSAQGSFMTNKQGSLLPQVNYYSMCLDDVQSTNTSMNTKALAAKYLVGNISFLSKDTSSNLSTILNPTEIQNLFQFYPNKNDLSTQFEVKENSLKKEFCFGQNVASKGLSKGSIEVSDQSLASTGSSSGASKIRENFQHNSETESTSESENDESSESDEEEIWIFGKPQTRKTSTSDFKSNNKKQTIKKKTFKMEKDFSDQDSDLDPEVTTVLDIEKLKKLPKLL